MIARIAFVCLLSFAAAQGCRLNLSRDHDDWERSAETADSACNPIDPSWILPVTNERRSEAIKMLSDVESLQINDSDIDYWTGVTVDNEMPETVSPFLIRAVAKNEFTGGFSAYECLDGVRIRHASLGHSTPPTIRLPVVIFLENKPAHVFPTWSMAE